MTAFTSIDLTVYETTAGLKVHIVNDFVQAKADLPGFSWWNTEYGALSVKVRYPKHIELLTIREAVYKWLHEQKGRL